MKRIIQVFCLICFLALFLSPKYAYCLGEKPKKSAPSEEIIAPSTASAPPARDMQIATGQISPINEEEHSN